MMQDRRMLMSFLIGGIGTSLDLYKDNSPNDYLVIAKYSPICPPDMAMVVEVVQCSHR
jgi:hypothetical protein